MSVNGIGNSSASWAQFVKLSQAARDRNSGLTANKATQGQGAASTNAVSFKRVTDVYLSTINQMAQAQGAQESARTQTDMKRKAAGGIFDAYA